MRCSGLCPCWEGIGATTCCQGMQTDCSMCRPCSFSVIWRWSVWRYFSPLLLLSMNWKTYDRVVWSSDTWSLWTLCCPLNIDGELNHAMLWGHKTWRWEMTLSHDWIYHASSIYSIR
jgi:hypothetical protein